MRFRYLPLSIAFGVLALALAWLIFCTPLGVMLALAFRAHPGTFDRAKLAAVVEQARNMNLTPDMEQEFRLENISDPKSLRPAKRGEIIYRGQGAGLVWAKISPDGKLRVVVETRDLGRAGSYGFAYSDKPLAAQHVSDDWSSLDVPGPLNLVQPNMRIDDHWWEVQCDD
jgi:hypothetical protein